MGRDAGRAPGIAGRNSMYMPSRNEDQKQEEGAQRGFGEGQALVSDEEERADEHQEERNGISAFAGQRVQAAVHQRRQQPRLLPTQAEQAGRAEKKEEQADDVAVAAADGFRILAASAPDF